MAGHPPDLTVLDALLTSLTGAPEDTARAPGNPTAP